MKIRSKLRNYNNTTIEISLLQNKDYTTGIRTVWEMLKKIPRPEKYDLIPLLNVKNVTMKWYYKNFILKNSHNKRKKIQQKNNKNVRTEYV